MELGSDVVVSRGRGSLNNRDWLRVRGWGHIYLKSGWHRGDRQIWAPLRK